MACAMPGCEYPAHADPDYNGFCCEKCEGRSKGEEWGGKKHTAYCTSKDPSGALMAEHFGGAPTPAYGGGCGGGGMQKFAPAGRPGAGQPCQNPECEYTASPDPEPASSAGFCCEKCQGRFNGEDWANSGKKHTAWCTKEYHGGGGGGGGGKGAFGKAAAASGPGMYDAETEAKLDEWVEAKRQKDFATADEIRSALRAQGIDAQSARPDPRKAAAMQEQMGWGMGGMMDSWGYGPPMGNFMMGKGAGKWGPY